MSLFLVFALFERVVLMLSKIRPLSFLTLLALLLVAGGHAFADEPQTVPYQGELIDDDGTAISGIFPVTFSFYELEDSRAALWTETRFVSVFQGAYDITLGDRTAIPAERLHKLVWLGISLGDLGELNRQEFIVTPQPPRPTRAQVIADLDISFADVADRSLFALEAREAEDCTLLGGKSLGEIDRYDELLEQIAGVRDQLNEISGARLGNRTTTLERIGGTGGNPYSRTCPPGHVVTGARGGAGALVDSIELICSPLQ